MIPKKQSKSTTGDDDNPAVSSKTSSTFDDENNDATYIVDKTPLTPEAASFDDVDDDNTHFLDDDATHFADENPLFSESSNLNENQFSEHLTVQYIIGEGGVGRVYLAFDEAIGRRVAVKELLNNPEQQYLSEQERQQLERSFIHEAKITAKLEHPSIIPVYQLGYRKNAGAYYVMRYVKGGETLEEKINRCQQSSTEQAITNRMKLLDTLIDTCDALAYAHSKGVVHRDLKPSNIISGKFGETIVLDWGLAQVLRDSDDDFFKNAQHHQVDTYSDNANNHGVGTLRYMAPEQLRGKVGRASDVYSLGVILFKIITGYLPYRGSPQDIKAQLLSDEPSPSPNQYISTMSMSPELSAICEKAMAKNPDDRFQDAGELVEQLKAYRDGRMVNIYSYSKQELFRRFVAKNKFLMFMIATLFVVVVSSSIFAVHYALQMDKARAQAERALISVTALGDQAQNEANSMAAAINAGINELFTDMRKVAEQLDHPPAKNPPSIQQLLDSLAKHYPDFSSFTIENSNVLPLNLGWKSSTYKFDAPILVKENNQLVMTFFVPLKQHNPATHYVVAKVFPDKVIPKFFPTSINNGHPRDIWLMQDDGVVFYDAEEKYRGTNLFTDTINNQSPSVVAFGQLTVDKPFGVSYYAFSDKGKKVAKIAAWQTLAFNKAKNWKIVVDYVYMMTDE